MDKQKVIKKEDLLNNEKSIVTSIKALSDDEKKEYLRQSEFIKNIDSFELESIINSMNFMNAFNIGTYIILSLSVFSSVLLLFPESSPQATTTNSAASKISARILFATFLIISLWLFSD